MQAGGMYDTRKVHGKQGVEDQRHHTVATSQSGSMEAIMQDSGENVVLHRRLIITCDETMKQDINDGQCSCICEKQFNIYCTLFLNSNIFQQYHLHYR